MYTISLLIGRLEDIQQEANTTTLRGFPSGKMKRDQSLKNNLSCTPYSREELQMCKKERNSAL